MNDEMNEAHRNYREMDDFDLMATCIEGSGGYEAQMASKALTVRFHLSNYAAITALAEMSNNAPKNTIANQLVEGAIFQVVSRLSESKREKFNAMHAEILGILVQEAGLDVSNERSGSL